MSAPMPRFAALMRDVPDFPQPGVLFKDITPLLADAVGFAQAVAAMAAPWRAAGVDCVAGIEARGFILGSALAYELRAGFVPIRKPGKLPPKVLSLDYALEYGHDRLEIHVDAVPPDRRVLLVDDVLATGGTLAAGRALLESAGAQLIGAAVLVELLPLRGRRRWRDDLPLLATLGY